MTKKEFLNILYEQLSDQMPEAKASAHTQYYHDYIQDAIKRGQKEKQVLDSLGDPKTDCQNPDRYRCRAFCFFRNQYLGLFRTGYLPYRKHRLWKSVGQ